MVVAVTCGNGRGEAVTSVAPSADLACLGASKFSRPPGRPRVLPLPIWRGRDQTADRACGGVVSRDRGQASCRKPRRTPAPRPIVQGCGPGQPGQSRVGQTLKRDKLAGCCLSDADIIRRASGLRAGCATHYKLFRGDARARPSGLANFINPTAHGAGRGYCRAREDPAAKPQQIPPKRSAGHQVFLGRRKPAGYTGFRKPSFGSRSHEHFSNHPLARQNASRQSNAALAVRAAVRRSAPQLHVVSDC
ncbi:hypothetical protein IMCC20628_03403 [Hoeflea sp. IMCC20628]|nr:hypothetical protein IMCC20628_03403 [Hoeflea sp. IMCC20628]